MKYLSILILAIFSISSHATKPGPEAISKQRFVNELNRMPVVKSMQAAKTDEEQEIYRKQLQSIWDFSKKYVDEPRVNRNSKSWFHVKSFSKSIKTWAEGQNMSYKDLLIRTDLIKSQDDYAEVKLYVEQEQCVIELNKFDGIWKITKELCPNLI